MSEKKMENMSNTRTRHLTHRQNSEEAITVTWKQRSHITKYMPWQNSIWQKETSKWMELTKHQCMRSCVCVCVRELGWVSMVDCHTNTNGMCRQCFWCLPATKPAVYDINIQIEWVFYIYGAHTVRTAICKWECVFRKDEYNKSLRFKRKREESRFAWRESALGKRILLLSHLTYEAKRELLCSCKSQSKYKHREEKKNTRKNVDIFRNQLDESAFVCEWCVRFVFHVVKNLNILEDVTCHHITNIYRTYKR